MQEIPQQQPQPQPRARLDADTLKHYWAQGPKARALMVGAVVLIVILMCAGISHATGSSTSPDTSANQTTQQQQHSSATNTPAKPKSWVTVNHFTGHANGTKTFDVFHIQNGDHLVWSTTVHGSANLFMASLYNKGQSFGNDLPYQDITDTANGQSQSDTITIQTDSADVYLWVETDSVTWTVDIQRYQ